jgi:hypothetical protein
MGDDDQKVAGVGALAENMAEADRNPTRGRAYREVLGKMTGSDRSMGFILRRGCDEITAVLPYQGVP